MRLPTHLERLEAESIFIIREVIAECERPVMLYSVGKDSSVVLHLAMKAFFPAKPPIPLLHIDTTWKFHEMIAFRDRTARERGLELIVHPNPDGVVQGMDPFTHGSTTCADIMKTQAMIRALECYGFDVVLGGTRRDEGCSKERIFSFRSAFHRWDPKNQRPEPWHLYNTRKNRGESILVFPLSNWTELDVWQYIYKERVPIMPLYLAKEHPVVERNGILIVVNDDHMPLRPGERPCRRMVRFRTLGSYPLTGAVESQAADVKDVLQEVFAARHSEQ